MTTEEVKKICGTLGKTFKDFEDFMYGQTYGIKEDGSFNWYELDVRRFIRINSK